MVSQVLHKITSQVLYSILNESSTRGNVTELGCEWGYEDFRNSVTRIRTEVDELKTRFGKSPSPSAGGTVRMIRV